MPSDLPRLFLVRHGDTPWTDTGQHTGRTDLALTDRGEQRARQLGSRLKGIEFARVLTSPLQRASKTCELAGFGDRAERDADLVEWDYGIYEGKLSREILQIDPEWQLFRDGCPEGESAAQVAARADRFVAKVREIPGNVLAFSSGHITRMIAARWLGLAPAEGRLFYCSPASINVLGYEHENLHEPIIRSWNEVLAPQA